MWPACRQSVSNPNLRSGILQGPLGRDHARVHARPVEAPEDARVLDLHATIHHDVEAAVERDPRSFLVADAELHPQHFRADGDRFTRDRLDVRRLSKAVDHVDRLADRGEIGKATLAEYFLVRWIHRD